MIETSPICMRCKKTPAELEEYVEAAEDMRTTPDRYVRIEEGTYNPETNTYACTDCYIAMGMPRGKAGAWR